ncbi:MAG: autotransporter outer membrane beta-barrel domain-containing protein [Albidovulum sp.]|nr:autotransporter outer membrane beta-barrel domain-containing protein [Albidovulum sp.]
MNSPAFGVNSAARERCMSSGPISAAAMSAVVSLLAYGARAQSVCQVSGDTATCTSFGNPFSGGIAFGLETGDPTKIVIGDSVEVTTSKVPGISLFGSGDLSVSLESGASSFSISTSGDSFPLSSYGIYAIPSDSAGSVSIEAIDVTTKGSNADGIHVRTKNGGISISSTGLIDVSGKEARGIYASNTPVADSEGNKIVSGPISISVQDVRSSADHTDYGYGAAVYARGAGRIVVTANGKLKTVGDENSAVRAIGRIIEQDDNTISVTTKDIETDGYKSLGVVATGIGKISITSTGTVETKGGESVGLFAETSTRTGSKIVISAKNVKTSGKNAQAIEAIAKGADQDGDDVEITISGEIETLGKNAHGVSAHSRSGGVQATVTKSGSIVSSNSGSYAVHIHKVEDQSNNMRYTPAGAVVNNFGRIAGNVLVHASGNPSFLNFGRFEPDGTADLGLQGELSNSGVLSPGGSGSSADIGSVDITGNFIQSSQGSLELDVDWQSGRSDKIDISGTADLAGEIKVLSLNKPRPQGGNRVAFLSAENGVTGENRITPIDTVLVDYSVEKSDIAARSGHKLELTASLNKDPDELNDNQFRVFDAIPEGEDSPISSLIQETNPEKLRKRLDGFGNEIAAAAQVTSLFSSLHFNENLDTCDDRQRSNLNASSSSYCTWTTMFGNSFESPGTEEQLGFQEKSKSFSAGVFYEFAGEPFAVSTGFIVEDGNLDMESNSGASMKRQQAGAKLHYSSIDFNFSLGLTIGSGEHEIFRIIPLDDSLTKVSGLQDSAFVGLHSAIERPKVFGAWTVTPSFQASFFSANSNPYMERGKSKYRLDVGSARINSAIVRPSLEFERHFGLGDYQFAPSIGFAATKIFGGDAVVDSNFAEGRSFPTRVSAHSSSVDISAKVQFYSESRSLTGNLSYNRSQSSGNSAISNWAGTISYRF